MLFWCFLKLDLVTVGNFALISSVVDCVRVNPSTRLDHFLLDAQKVCTLTIVGTVLKDVCAQNYVPTQRSFFKLATQKSNDIPLPKRQNNLGVTDFILKRKKP